MTWLIGAVCGVAALYQLVAIAACVWHRHRPRRSLAGVTPPVSILKPIRGITPDLKGAIRSHLEQEYPTFELLLGVRESEAALEVSDPRARVVTCHTVTPNGKVGTLIDLAREARYPILIVNDADIRVPPDYLRDVVAELEPVEVGLVTCLYRGHSTTPPGCWEALGVASDFAPSALVAPFVGVSEFGLGSTLAFRRDDLARIGGFEAISLYLADDYQLGCRLHGLGRQNVIAAPVVSTSLSPPDWASAWRHQVRWARTVRLSRPEGYLGLPVTFATLWAVIAMSAGMLWVGAGLLSIRLAMAVTAGYGVLASGDVLKYLYLIPLRDIYTVAVWCAALFGNRVEWGGEILVLDREGRIIDKK